MHSLKAWNHLAGIAQENGRISKDGSYRLSPFTLVSVADDLRAACRRTRSLDASDTEQLLWKTSFRPPQYKTVIDVTGETSTAAAQRLVSEHGSATVLNFANAVTPGGGYLGGARAQEEDLCRSSGLYTALLRAPDYYHAHKGCEDWASHRLIWSPEVPVWRDTTHALLQKPYKTSFITAAAPRQPYAHGAAKETVQALMNERTARILALAATKQVKNLILGAFGCGAFGNDPYQVGSAWQMHLQPGGAYHGAFERVTFAVYDTSPQRVNFNVFDLQLGGNSSVRSW